MDADEERAIKIDRMDRIRGSGTRATGSGERLFRQGSDKSPASLEAESSMTYARKYG
jgi:hypothetical protein